MALNGKVATAAVGNCEETIIHVELSHSPQAPGLSQTVRGRPNLPDTDRK